MQDLAVLRAQIASQQEQIEKLRQALESQQAILDRVISPAKPVVASLTPVVPMAALQLPKAQAAAPANPCEAGPDATVPAYLRVGGTCIIPVGFMDLTATWKDKNAGGSLGTNFGSIPYNNTTAAKLSEFRFSPQNSRLGFRAEGNFHGAHFTGYNEFDFLGTSGSNNLSVTNGAFVPRIRLFWVDVRKGKFEFLAGQSWTMLTPNRKGISALPGDLFYSQTVDVNYMIGLTWNRQPGMRFLYHPSSKATMGLSLENPDQYIGGSAGGSSITLPGALTSLGGGQLDNSTNVQTTPNAHPDIIAKVAFDPSAKFHLEFAGLQRTFRVWNPLTSQHFTKAGAGGSVNANLEVMKNVRVVTNNFWSDGGGRYLFGQAPDVVVRADGSLSAIHAGGTVNGIEATVNKVLLYAYYGGVYIGRNTALDANGTTRVGYGYTGSPNSQNRSIQEITFGLNHTIWKNPRYGALNWMAQYEYALRNPWYVAPNSPKATHDNTVYFNLRYSLPGEMPKF